jgi:hypothetical protein
LTNDEAIETADVINRAYRAVRDSERDKSIKRLAEESAFLDVGLRPTLGLNVRVADEVLYDRAFACKFTLRHG